MKRLISTVPLLFIALLHSHAQSISGMVSAANARSVGAIIKNLATSNQVISDNNGMFSIRVKKGDTLLTSQLFYKTDTLVYTAQSYLAIQLHAEKIPLREVTIKATKLSPLDIYEQNKQEYKDIYWKGDYSHMFGASIGTMPGIALNIDKLYNLLSKQGKDARTMQRTLTRDYHDDVIDRRFTKTLVGNITGYDGSKLDTFMMKYRPTYDFITKVSDYDIMNYVKEKFALDVKTANESEK